MTFIEADKIVEKLYPKEYRSLSYERTVKGCWGMGDGRGDIETDCHIYVGHSPDIISIHKRTWQDAINALLGTVKIQDPPEN